MPFNKSVDQTSVPSPGDPNVMPDPEIRPDIEVFPEEANYETARTGMNRWIVGARPRTWPAAVVPVLVGTAVALHESEASWVRYVLALVVAIAMEIGVNYANDYSDGIKGTDNDRIGPTRLVASGLAKPDEVRRAAFIAFGIAAICGFILSALTSIWLLAVGGAAIFAAWSYTGGSKPYGYQGYGELSAFIFFGLVATIGTTYVHTERVLPLACYAAVPVGLHSVALLLINNLRDISSDREAGKHTLAVRIGETSTRSLFLVVVTVPFLFSLVLGIFPGMHAVWITIAAMVALPAVIAPIRQGVAGKDLIPVLGATGRLQLVFGLLFAVGLGA